MSSLLSDPEARARIGARGRECVDGNRGALAKLLSLIEPLLEPAAPRVGCPAASAAGAWRGCLRSGRSGVCWRAAGANGVPAGCRAG